MDEKQKYNLLEKYFEGELSPEEEASFQHLLKTDTAFKKEFDFQTQLQEELASEELHAFRKTVQQVDRDFEYKQEAKTRQLGNNLIRNILALAAVFIIVFFVYKSFNTDSEFSRQQYLADNFEAYQMILTQRTIDSNEISLRLSNAINFYQNQQYKEAASSFSELKNFQPENASFHFYSAMSSFMADDFETAESEFLELIARDDHLFVEQSRWFLGILYLKNDKIDELKKLFSTIQKGDFKYAQVQVLLKNL
jgi:hypothetical protein